MAFAACFFAALSSASIIVPVSGGGTLSSLGNSGDAVSYMTTITDMYSQFTISYDITVTTDNTPAAQVHADHRGFGDTTGGSDPLQAPNETLHFTIGGLTVTANPGYDVVSRNIAVKFDAFDLVNNGSNQPKATWTIGASSGMYTNTGGSGGHAETVTVSGAGSVMVVDANNHWMWINDIDTSYTGSVEVIPEPTSYIVFTGMFLCLGLAGWWRQRRHAA